MDHSQAGGGVAGYYDPTRGERLPFQPNPTRGDRLRQRWWALRALLRLEWRQSRGRKTRRF